MPGLPAALLLLIAAHADGAQAQAQARRLLPTAIRKMSLDGGEKFYHEYLAFEETEDAARLGLGLQGPALLSREEERLLGANSSAAIPYRPPFAPHLGASGLGDAVGGRGGWELFRRSREVVARLERRQYACPGGTSSCASIGYPNSCCQTGLQCAPIPDTGLGPVGCCPQGVACTGSIACSGSQLACSSEIGGGCCIEGYVCATIGCKLTASLA